MADREAFDAYVRERWAPLLRTATLLTGDRHAAEDLVQETLVRAAQHWSRVEPGARPTPTCAASSTPARSTPGGGAGTSPTRWTSRRTPTPRRPPTDAAGCRRDPPHARRGAGAAHPAAAGRARAAVLRGPHRGRRRPGARLLGEHREVPDPPRPGAAARPRARARRHLRTERRSSDEHPTAGTRPALTSSTTVEARLASPGRRRCLWAAAGAGAAPPALVPAAAARRGRGPASPWRSWPRGGPAASVPAPSGTP